MFTLIEENSEFREINEQMKNILAEIISRLPFKLQSLEFSAGHSFFSEPTSKKKFFYIRDGFARFELQNKVLFLFEAGDLFGWRNLVSEGAVVVADCPITVDMFAADEFFSAINSSSMLQQLWHSYTECEYNLHVVFLSTILEEEVEEVQQRRSYEPGAMIIQEGAIADQVFLMLKGQADVTVGDTKVGEISSGEIFGAMAATMNTVRSASVVARTRCAVSVLPKENFLALVKTHPRTVNKLIENMARIIVSQNEKIVGMTQ